MSSLEKELETVCTDEHDEDLVVADYNSDAEETGDAKEDEDNEEEHITKVSVEFSESKQIVDLNFSRLFHFKLFFPLSVEFYLSVPIQ